VTVITVFITFINLNNHLNSW